MDKLLQLEGKGKKDQAELQRHKVEGVRESLEIVKDIPMEGGSLNDQFP